MPNVEVTQEDIKTIIGKVISESVSKYNVRKALKEIEKHMLDETDNDIKSGLKIAYDIVEELLNEDNTNDRTG